MEKMSMIYEALLGLHAEMILDEAMREYRVKRLYEDIDRALQNGDQESFLELTGQLRILLQESDQTHQDAASQ